MKRIVVILFIFSLSNIFLCGAFKLMGGFTHYNYKQENESLETKIIPAVGIGIDTEFSTEKTMLMFDMWASLHEKNLNFSGNNRYFKMVNVNCDILFKYKFSQIMSPYVFFGGSVGLIIPTKTDSYGKKIKDSSAKEVLWDFGPVVGVGIDFSGKKYSISIDGRYRFGVADLKHDGMNFKKNTIFMAISIKF